eukprot:gene38216-29319_t
MVLDAGAIGPTAPKQHPRALRDLPTTAVGQGSPTGKK